MYGAGRCGDEGWPLQAAQGRPDWVFLQRRRESNKPTRDAERILEALKGKGHVVGHSYGGLAALLAAQRRPDQVRSLVLCEPSAFDVARGERVVEQHIAAMAPVFAVADDSTVSAEDFEQRFAAGMGLPPPAWDAEVREQIVARMRATTPPWEVDLQRDIPKRVPTLVLTGDATPIYAAVAHVLADQGAQHVTVPGAGHRPQDTEEGMQAMLDFWSTIAPPQEPRRLASD